MPALDANLPQINVFGAAEIFIKDTTEVGKYQSLGITRNGIDQTEEAFWLDVPGDEYGGDDGPPVDVQFLGVIARLRCELTKYNAVNADIIRARVDAIPKVGAGYVHCDAIGRLAFGGAGFFSLRIVPSCGNPPYNAYYEFPMVIPRSPIEVNLATKFASMIIEFECHREPISGRIYTHAFGTP